VAAVAGIVGLVVGESTPNPYYYSQAGVVVWLAATGALTMGRIKA